MWYELSIAFALLLVLEGMIPFLSPRMAKKISQQVSNYPEKTLRIFGFSSMLSGVILLYFLR